MTTTSATYGTAAGSVRTPQAIRLVADDLTGALDTAAQFAIRGRPIAVAWSETAAERERGSVVIDSGCRELPAVEASDRFARFVGVLAPHPGSVSFLKLDSLLRGHAGDEIAACSSRWPSRPIIVAPAFPAQRRVTRDGRQVVLTGNADAAAGEDIGATLSVNGIAYARRRPGDVVPPGVSLWDAETDSDLASIATASVPPGELPLWCGSAGLASALARGVQPLQLCRVMPVARPLLGLVGSDHEVMRQQLAAISGFVVQAGNTDAEAISVLNARLRNDGTVFVTLTPRAGLDRYEARQAIEQRGADLLRLIAPPATLFVSGGETLRSVCQALKANALTVDGELAPGVPTSTIQGGAWYGVRVVSKSGAFGGPDMLVKLIERSAPDSERQPS